MEVWETSWAPHRGQAGEQRWLQEEGQVEEEAGEAAADRRLQALEEVEGGKHQTWRGEAGERVGRGRGDQSWKAAEEAEGCQSQGEVEGSPCQRVAAEVEAQGAEPGWGERWVEVRPRGEQEAGGWDSACCRAFESELRTERRCTCGKRAEVREQVPRQQPRQRPRKGATYAMSGGGGGRKSSVPGGDRGVPGS